MMKGNKIIKGQVLRQTEINKLEENINPIVKYNFRRQEYNQLKDAQFSTVNSEVKQSSICTCKTFK